MIKQKFLIYKNFLFFFCGLYLLFSLIDMVISFGIKHSDYGEFGKVNKIMDKQYKPTIAIFGSSVGENGINPNIITKKTGLSAYNYSLIGTSLLQYNSLLNEFNDGNTTTKVILIADNYELLTKRTGITDAKYYTTYIQNENIYQSFYTLQPKLANSCKYVPFYKFVVADHIFYKSAFIGLKNYFTQKNNIDSLKGQIADTHHINQNELNRLIGMNNFRVNVNDTSIKCLNALFKKAQSKNQKVILLLTPIYIAGINKIENIDELRSVVKKVTSQYSNVTFLDYSISNLSYEKSFFFNAMHLNNTGANYLSHILANTTDSICKQTLLN
jgi:hypothetical protein